MKKTINLLKLFALTSAILVTFSYCSKDDDETTTSLSELSGIITMPGGDIAGGAIVQLSTTANAANVIAKTITDNNGKYKLMGISNGTYFISSIYNPANTNNLLKSAGVVILSSKEVSITIEGNKEMNLEMEGKLSGGNTSFSLNGGWEYDNSHSTIEFEFPYDAVNGIFTGHFATVGFDVLEFDESNPANIKIKAWVDVTSTETGAPSGVCGHGRDGITGCIAGTFGVDLNPADTVTVYCEDGKINTGFPNTEMAAFDLWGDGSTTTYTKQSAIVGKTGVATFVSTSVSAFGNGYVAKGNFFFNGATKEVDLYFNYLEGYDNDTRYYSSFFGWFKFNALSDYGIDSGHIVDSDVTVKVSAQFRKNK